MNLETAILKEVNCRPGMVLIPALVEAYGEEIKAVLWTMRYEGKLRLIAVGDPESYTLNEVTPEQGIQGECEVFLWAEKV